MAGQTYFSAIFVSYGKVVNVQVYTSDWSVNGIGMGKIANGRVTFYMSGGQPGAPYELTGKTNLIIELMNPFWRNNPHYTYNSLFDYTGTNPEIDFSLFSQ